MSDPNPLRRNFMELARAQWQREKFVCVGLDTDWAKIPAGRRYAQKDDAIAIFNEHIIDQTGDVAGAYKLNLAFYLMHGEAGITALRRTILYIRKRFPVVPVILDAKFGDIGNTSEAYLAFALAMSADAVTLNPYLGQEAIAPFLKDKDLGCVILCRTSNEGGNEFQDLPAQGWGLQIYKHVAFHVANTERWKWNKNGNCMLVVGATCPDELQAIRKIAPDTPLLIPGVGAQGGELEKIVPHAMDSTGGGFLINSSRGITFAADPLTEALTLHASINALRKAARP